MLFGSVKIKLHCVGEEDMRLEMQVNANTLLQEWRNKFNCKNNCDEEAMAALCFNAKTVSTKNFSFNVLGDCK